MAVLGRILARLRGGGDTVVVCGALRSGTNYLRFLLERNYACRVSYDAYGWKHAGVPILADGAAMTYPDVPILFVAKDPYAFCVSLHRYHTRHGRNLVAPTEWARFLREPLVVLNRDPERSPQLRFANPVQYWSFVYWNLAFLPAGRFRAHGLRYEDLMADPEGRLEPVARALGLRRRPAAFVTPEAELRRMKDRSAALDNPYLTTTPFDRERYAARAHLDAYGPEDRAFVRAQLDPALLERLGYPPDPAA